MKKPQPEDIVEPMYTAIGQAITAWQWVESGLLSLFVQFTKPANGDAITAAFFSVENFRSKLSMVDAAARVSLKSMPQMQDEWAAMFAEGDKLRRMRNKLAHHGVQVFGTKRGIGPPVLMQHLASFGESIDPDKLTAAPKMTLAAIKETRGKFITFGSSAFLLSQKIRLLQAPPGHSRQ